MAQQIGTFAVPLRDPAGAWRGITLGSKATPGGFDLVENGYVSSDGLEIRSVPGYVCVIDPETQTRKNDGTDTTTGYRATHIDAVRDVHVSTGSYFTESPGMEVMKIYTEPASLHFVEQMGGRWYFVGESEFRREPISGTTSTWCRVATASAASAGGNIDLALSDTPAGGGNLFNTADNADCSFYVWISGMTGDLATLLNDKAHRVSAVAGNVLSLTTTSPAAASSLSQNGWIAKVVPANFTTGGTPISEDEESLTSWCSLALGNPASAPSTSVECAHVFNRQRDFGDYTGSMAEGAAAGVTVGPSRRRQKAVPYRLNPHVAGNRIVMAAPGYGCVFQIPGIIPIDYGLATGALGVASIGNDIYDRPRSAGVPKCVQWEDPDKAVATTHHIYAAAAADAYGGSSHTDRAGTYAFRFAYKDEATGEIGLWSEPVIVKTDGSTIAREGLQFFVYHPGYLMHETGALSILAWRTKKDGSEFYYTGVVRPLALASIGATSATTSTYGYKYGLTPDATYDQFWQHAVCRINWISDDLLDEIEGPVVPVLNEMPMGCKAARTIRGWTFYGGALGDAGSMQQLQSGKLTMYFDVNAGAAINPNHDELTSRHSADYSANFYAISYTGVDTGFGCAKTAIPTAYSGNYVFSRNLLPSGGKMVLIDKIVNTVCELGAAGGSFGATNYSEHMPDIRYKIQQTPIDPGSDYTYANSQGATSYLRLPRGIVQISEPDNPGVTPDTNITTISNELDQDIEGIGEAGGQAVLATRSKTYLLAWADSPIGTAPATANDKFGCIAANSMSSYEGACAWLSDRGPVEFGASVRWIGRDVWPWFNDASARYLRDSRGMMRHSWACHDPIRQLVWFGVFADRAAGTAQEVTVSYRGTSYNWTTAAAHADADKILSRFPCDEVLIYSYQTGAWSVWRPPLTLAIQWMTVGLDSEGVQRLFFLGSDRRLYVMDDSFAVFGATATSVAISAAATTATFTASGSSCRVGVPVALYGSTGDLKALSTIASVGTGTVTLAASLSVKAGDTLAIGVKQMVVRSAYVSMRGADAAAVRGVSVKFDVYGPATSPVWAHASVATLSQWDGLPAKRTTRLSDQDARDGSLEYSRIGIAEDNGALSDYRIACGSSTGMSHQVELRFASVAQVRLAQASVEFA